MADGFIVRRGGGGRFYEGTVELNTQKASFDIDVGFKPKAVHLYITDNDEGDNERSVTTLAVFFDGGVAKGSQEHLNQHFLLEELTAITYEQTASGFRGIHNGTSQVCFHGTYKVFATA